MVSQWYYAATRNGAWWNWWNYRKSFYWFSPGPCPVEWYEYFFIVQLVVLFSSFIEGTVLPASRGLYGQINGYFASDVTESDVSISETLCNIIDNMTGICPDMDSTLEEVGLASVGLPQIIGILNNSFSSDRSQLNLRSSSLIHAKSMQDMVNIVEEAKLQTNVNEKPDA